MRGGLFVLSQYHIVMKLARVQFCELLVYGSCQVYGSFNIKYQFCRDLGNFSATIFSVGCQNNVLLTGVMCSMGTLRPSVGLQKLVFRIGAVPVQLQHLQSSSNLNAGREVLQDPTIFWFHFNFKVKEDEF